ncbi:MAG: hypothetical protein WHT06_02690 [Desulfobacterales bacterium]
MPDRTGPGGRKPFRLRAGCFGDFQARDAICRRYCAIRIRCLIAREERIELERTAELEGGAARARFQ